MPDPLLVEERFQILVEELEPVESIRQRISLIREFLHFLEGGYGKFESYIIELIQYWPLYSGPITYSGISPFEILDDLRLLEEIGSNASAVATQEKFSEITVRLREVAVILFMCLGDVRSALKMVETRDEKGKSDPVETEVDTENNNIQSFQDFRKVLLLEYKSKAASGLLVNIDRIIEDLDYILIQKSQNDTLVPVTESFSSLEGEDRIYGRLRRLKVKVNDLIDRQDDRIVRRYSVMGVEKPSWLEDSRVSLAARALLNKFSHGIEIKHYSGEIFYEYSGAMHQGNSAKAAMAVLWYTGLQKKEEIRERYQLNQNIAITGDIDEEGNLLPVSGNSIKAKVHAAFYSWATVLIVPASQAELCREELQNLNEKHPGKKLTLLAPDRLEELFFDRRISTHLNPSKARYIGGRLWEKKFETVGVVTILLMSLVIFRLANGPLDKNPVLYEYRGEVLRVLNEGGALLDELHVGEFTVRVAEGTSNLEIVDFADVTGDGIEEIFWGEFSLNPTSRISMKEVEKKDKHWEHDIHYNFMFPNKPYVFENNYRPRKIVAEDFDYDGEIELLLNSSHRTYFPGVLSLRQASTGEEISHFVHPGRILDFTVLDLNGDGQLEVVICGISNAYNQAFLAVLDIDKIDGYGPSTDEYFLEGYQTADLNAYMLFPKTIVANSVTTNSFYNQAERVHFIEEYGLLQLYISDLRNYDEEDELQTIERAYLYVYINPDLSIHGIGTSDDYDVTAEFLYNNGTLERYPDHEYFEEYQNSFLYWNGEGFITKTGNLD